MAAAAAWLALLLLVWLAAPAAGGVSDALVAAVPSFEVAGTADVQAHASSVGESLAMVREVEALNCGTQAYARLMASCRTIIEDDDLKKRMAVLFTNCFLQQSGRGTLDKPAFPCEEHDNIKSCTTPIYEDNNNNAWTTYFGFYKAVHAICHHLQSGVFVRRTEEAVTSLQVATMETASSLHSLSTTSASLLAASNLSLAIQRRLQAQNDRLATDIGRTADIAGLLLEGQRAVAEAQRELEEAAREGFGHVEDGLAQVRSGMDTLRTWQEELVRGSEVAASALAELRVSQHAAWSEARVALSAAREAHAAHIVDEANHHARVVSAHQHILNATRAAASAQEEFVTKQAEVFSLLSRILSLHALLARELLTIKALVFYAAASLLSFTLTSVPRTAGARLPLYVGLTLNFAMERCVAWAVRHAHVVDTDNVGMLVSVSRTAWGVYACVCLCAAAWMYKDYARLAHESVEELRANIVAWKRGDANKSAYARQLAVVAARQRAKLRRSLSLTPSTPQQARSPLLLAHAYATLSPWEALQHQQDGVHEVDDDTESDPDYVPACTALGSECGEEMVQSCYELRPRRRQVSHAWVLRVRRLLSLETAADFARTVHLQCLRTLFGDDADCISADIDGIANNDADSDNAISDSCDTACDKDHDRYCADDDVNTPKDTTGCDDVDSATANACTRKRRRTTA